MVCSRVLKTQLNLTCAEIKLLRSCNCCKTPYNLSTRLLHLVFLTNTFDNMVSLRLLYQHVFHMADSVIVFVYIQLVHENRFKLLCTITHILSSSTSWYELVNNCTHYAIISINSLGTHDFYCQDYILCVLKQYITLMNLRRVNYASYWWIKKKVSIFNMAYTLIVI